MDREADFGSNSDLEEDIHDLTGLSESEASREGLSHEFVAKAHRGCWLVAVDTGMKGDEAYSWKELDSSEQIELVVLTEAKQSGMWVLESDYWLGCCRSIGFEMRTAAERHS